MLSRNYSASYFYLAIILVVVFFLSLIFGAIVIRADEIMSAFSDFFSGREMPLQERIFFDIRLPRAINCILVGASLAMAGVLMQALFRNPIVEPGLVGTSSGAALGASLYFVLGATLKFNAGVWTLPIAASAGGACATVLVFLLSHRREASQSIISLLLTGIAVNALCLSGVGLMSYLARDPQARSITFWNLGTLSGSSWNSVILIGASTLICFFISLRLTKALNALAMGEAEALHLGVNINRLKVMVITVTVVLVAVATAFVGVISFVGLIVPHFLRLMKGSDNRFLLIGSALLGGIILSLADLTARLWLAPAELPIGIVTSVVGVPVFIFLLRRNQHYF
ncbi:MAG: ABC transporter, permease protein (cluster 8, B12/iron complex) [Cytophagales bacterium]|jgi:iron complex transport system permease protein|nr:iron ABC transporter permease [Bacteroidota bacterium]MBS1979559.1 iron ABC transporter permease [Bacteroidota bacterium]WHZ09240.1 MAG: ABC transporter, permease protein (cluster 8, B12/iron complex) [Cytophagales bacterium]